ncbi:MAG: hypothetical protein FWC34_09760 [Bacteroidetes bacterium]|nr:hypothetical protein [Bacteroidota bacterium]MCL2301860.1 hypothetical protein [Lentimicrobiaceae bacterium]
MATSKKNETQDKKKEKLIISETELKKLHDEVYNLTQQFPQISQDIALSDAERKQMRGSGIRRYGFIDKVSDLAMENPKFVPPYMDVNELKNLIRQIEVLRNTAANLQQMLRMVNDELLTDGNEAYRLALIYYNSVSSASRSRVPGAEALFNTLRPFFKSSSSKSTGELTEKKVMHDAKKLIKGKADGKIIIKNEKPATSGGIHEVIDEVHSGHTAFE